MIRRLINRFKIDSTKPDRYTAFSRICKELDLKPYDFQEGQTPREELKAISKKNIDKHAYRIQKLSLYLIVTLIAAAFTLLKIEAIAPTTLLLPIVVYHIAKIMNELSNLQDWALFQYEVESNMDLGRTKNEQTRFLIPSSIREEALKRRSLKKAKAQIKQRTYRQTKHIQLVVFNEGIPFVKSPYNHLRPVR